MGLKSYNTDLTRKQMSYTTRRSLLNRIVDGDEIAWQEFYDQYHRLIFSIGRRWNLPDSQCDDLVQQVMISIFKNNLTFKYRPELGKFRTFLTGITKNILLKLKSEQKLFLQEDDNAEQKDLVEDNETIFNEEWHKYLLDAMLNDLRNTVDSSTFDAFQMYVLQGLRPEQIANVLNISVKTVYVHKMRCMEHLKRSLDHLKKIDPEFHF